ncbi:predicted protein [Botrytis cinerea T4]|uniref:Uncharacterized protein n=1 Tax=Botryotinia fuckeliana (strain T4) TaxID=999810 RepID=G2XT70_BOTF4|nr:predicted protein [Botrytis cinerea T4]
MGSKCDNRAYLIDFREIENCDCSFVNRICVHSQHQMHGSEISTMHQVFSTWTTIVKIFKIQVIKNKNHTKVTSKQVENIQGSTNLGPAPTIDRLL